MDNFLPAAAYLPHRPPMVLVERVMSVSDDRVHCQVSTNRDGPLAPFLDQQGALPAWFGVEIMAQTIGVWSGWQARQAGQQQIKPGMLLGGRDWRAHVPCFPADALLDIHMRLLMRDERLGSFEGEILLGDQVLATGRLNTCQPTEDELQQLMLQGKSA